MLQAFQILFSAVMIAFASWLSKKTPQMAGLLIALPLASMLVLPFSYLQHKDAEASVKFAQEIFVAIPVSLMFFVPFAFASRWNLGFWQAYVAGVVLLVTVFLIVNWLR